MAFDKKWGSVLLPRTFIIAILFSLYTLSFIITPFWNLSSSVPVRFVLLLFTAAAGVGWSVAAGSALRIQLNLRSGILFTILLLLAITINFRQLIYALPWRGDEYFHIKRTLLFLEKILTFPTWGGVGLFAFIIFLILAWKKPRWAEITGALIILGIVFFILVKAPFHGVNHGLLLRYPTLTTWLAAIPPLVATWFAHPYYEALYRVIPVFFAAALCWVFQNQQPSSNIATRLIWGISIATLPLVFYYSSIDYLEMPAVFMMMVVCFNIKNLLYAESVQVRDNPAWPSLVLIGLIKETTIPILVIFLVCRWAVQIYQAQPWSLLNWHSGKDQGEDLKKKFLRLIPGEIRIAIAILFPVVFYVLLRSNLAEIRSFGLNLSNIIDPRAYSAFAHSFVDQFGIFLLFFIFGLIILLRNKEFAIVAFILMTFVGVPLFHILDSWVFAGYSRFNLFVLPLILYGTSVFIAWIAVRKKWFSAGIACLAILISLLITPINMDGSKKPSWDSYNIDTAEHYYPYPQAISWLRNTHPQERVITAGCPTSYPFDFYQKKLAWEPIAQIKRKSRAVSDIEALDQSLSAANEQNAQVILFQVSGNKPPTLANMQNFHQEKVIQNDAHMLVIYSRNPP